MTPHQRMFAAIGGEPVDRLPFATYNCHGFGFGGHAGRAGYGPILEAVRRTGAGVLCKVSARRIGGEWCREEWSEQTEGSDRVTTRVLHTPAGPLRAVTRKPPDQPARCVEHFLKDDRDIERFLSQRPGPVVCDADRLRAHCEEIGPHGVAYVGYHDPFGIVSGLFDQEDFLIRIHTDPDPIQTLLEWAFRWARDDLAALLEALSKTQVKVLLYCCGPEWATPPLMPPEVFPRVVTPFQSRLVAMIHEHGRPASLHCHGRVRQVFGEVPRCGFDALEPIEPPDQGDISLAELRAAAGDALCLMGYVQDQWFYTSTPQRIRRHLAEIVETIGRGTRFIATGTCTPFQFPPTPAYVANYVAFLEAAAELGA